jgi:hypothetical protein
MVAFNKKAKILKTMIMESDDYARKKLIDFYNNQVWPGLIGKYDSYKTYSAADTVEVRQQVENGLKLDIIICSEGFSEKELDELRDWPPLCEAGALCIQVRLISGTNLCAGLF